MLRALVESITDEVWFADADGKLTLVNPAVWRESGTMAGEPVEAIAARFEVYRADGSPRPPSEAPPLRALRGETIRDEEESVRIPSSGELRHRLVSGAPVRDGSGAVIGSVCVVRDITERKLLEEELRRDREDSDRAQMVGQIGSWRLDVRENILRCPTRTTASSGCRAAPR
jgi:PAS domain S-box-containing protein